MKKCEIADCESKAEKVLGEGDTFFLLCQKHYDILKAEVDKLEKRIENMTEDEMIERLKELDRKKVIH